MSASPTTPDPAAPAVPPARHVPILVVEGETVTSLSVEALCLVLLTAIPPEQRQAVIRTALELDQAPVFRVHGSSIIRPSNGMAT